MLKGIVGMIWLEDGSTHWSREYLSWKYGYTSLDGEKILNCSKYLLFTRFSGLTDPRWIDPEEAIKVIEELGYRAEAEVFTTRSCSGICHEWKVMRLYAYVYSREELDRIEIELVNRASKTPIECNETPEKPPVEPTPRPEPKPRPVEPEKPEPEEKPRPIPFFDISLVIERLKKKLRGVKI